VGVVVGGLVVAALCVGGCSASAILSGIAVPVFMRSNGRSAIDEKTPHRWVGAGSLSVQRQWTSA
jgi:hypothetical protein